MPLFEGSCKYPQCGPADQLSRGGGGTIRARHGPSPHTIILQDQETAADAPSTPRVRKPDASLSGDARWPGCPPGRDGSSPLAGGTDRGTARRRGAGAYPGTPPAGGAAGRGTAGASRLAGGHGVDGLARQPNAALAAVGCGGGHHLVVQVAARGRVQRGHGGAHRGRPLVGVVAP